MGSIAPQSPFKTAKPVTLAKVAPSEPPANGSSPSRPRNAVVKAILANQVKFIASIGTVILLCTFSSERIKDTMFPGHLSLGIEDEQGSRLSFSAGLGSCFVAIEIIVIAGNKW